jgi:hypothetical protein
LLVLLVLLVLYRSNMRGRKSLVGTLPATCAYRQGGHSNRTVSKMNNPNQGGQQGGGQKPGQQQQEPGQGGQQGGGGQKPGQQQEPGRGGQGGQR